MFAGAGSENVAFFVPPVGRWGDYTDLTVDPTDGCTFWYVNEYFAALAETDPSAPWQTRIGSFKFPTCVPTPVQLVGVASRKTHGNVGTFDVTLPPTGPRGVECRSGGANGNHTLIFTFSNVLTNVAKATVTAGTGTVSSSAIGSDHHQYIVNLTGVANAQYITVGLTNVYDGAGGSSSVVSASMGVLLGDTNADGNVDGTDVSQTKSQSGNSAATGTAYREDVNLDGFVDGTDVSFVKSRSGGHIPPP
jgi:hypothetical protein